MISLFTSLTETHADAYDLEWAEWLGRLAAEPTAVFVPGATRGWSPVTFDPPSRALANVRAVHALVLDYDNGATWDAVTSAWGQWLGLTYTTKSHGDTAAKGKSGDCLRVVLPLARPVTVAEHARLWTWASRRSPTPLDKACKDASRFWYVPTAPPGGWRAHLTEGARLDPDTALAEEPPSLRIVPPPARTSDEREKRARAYVARMPGAVAGQGGHVALFNAVSSVMIGFDLDAGTTERIILDEYNPRCEPPWQPREVAHKLASVAARSERARGYLLVERPRVASASHAAQHAPTPADEESADWRAQLIVKTDNTPLKRYTNTALFVRCAGAYRGKWALNEMTREPWFDGAPMPEAMIGELREAIERCLGYSPPVADVDAAVLAAAGQRPFHPVVAYLRSLDWDGRPRLDEMARDYLSTSDPVAALMVRRFMISAVARACRPGCKVDTALMLVGDQGIRKSTFFAVLGGAWHADSFIDITNKDGLMTLHAAWLYEFAELENVVSQRTESRLKAWMSSTHDAFRLPYAKATVSKPRGVVICGSTNRRQFLSDDTGSRRFWIIEVDHEIDAALLADYRDQLWAEALAAYEAGEQWWLDRTADKGRADRNAAFEESDPWEGPISGYLEGRRQVTIAEVLTNAIKIDVAQQDRRSELRAARVVRSIGWWLTRGVEADGTRPRVYRRPAT